MRHADYAFVARRQREKIGLLAFNGMAALVCGVIWATHMAAWALLVVALVNLAVCGLHIFAIASLSRTLRRLDVGWDE
jgi:hypothetical protein